jgi:hypothetical protein
MKNTDCTPRPLASRSTGVLCLPFPNSTRSPVSHRILILILPEFVSQEEYVNDEGSIANRGGPEET